MARPWREIGRYGSVGIEFVLTILICAFIGHWLDGRYGGGHDWGIGIGFLLGVAVGFRNLVRTAQGMQRDIERAEARDPAAGRWTVDESWVYKPDDSGKPCPTPIRTATGDGPVETAAPRHEAPAGRLDARLRASLQAVALSGVALTLSALALGGGGAAISVAAGAALALTNLWVMAKVVIALLPDHGEGAARARGAWALVAALKMLALLSTVWLLMGHGLVSPLPVLVGLLSLPFGIAIGSLVSDRNAAPGDR